MSGYQIVVCGSIVPWIVISMRLTLAAAPDRRFSIEAFRTGLALQVRKALDERRVAA